MIVLPGFAIFEKMAYDAQPILIYSLFKNKTNDLLFYLCEEISGLGREIMIFILFPQHLRHLTWAISDFE